MAVLKHQQPPRRTSSLRRCYELFRRKDSMVQPVGTLAGFTNPKSDPDQPVLGVPLQVQAEKREGTSNGLLDLEKELTCSICTDILYQPLTLLDCLHTFCGGCLKEWFKWQGVSAAQKLESERGYSQPHISNPYTCPSCRAPVRETRPNASITTLLDMWLQANPDKDKSEVDKQEVAKGYTRGDNVLPDVRELRRTVREVRGSRRTGTESDSDGAESAGRRLTRQSNLSAPVERARGETGDSSSEETRHRRRGGERIHRRQNSETIASEFRRDSERASRRDRSAQPEQSPLEHQSSLRSLLSVTDMDSQEMEEQIMRQIMEEGLLDGIDLRNMDVHQEEELSERIARAFRRRQREQQRERRQESERRRAAGEAIRVQEERQLERERVQERQSRPPVSRPRLLEAAASSANAQRRATSQGNHRRSSSRTDIPSVSSTDHHELTQASRSATDLALRTRSREGSSDRRSRLSSRERRSTNPEARSISEAWRATGVSADARGASTGRPSGNVEVQLRSAGARRESQTSLQQRSTSSSNSSLTTSTAPVVNRPTVRLPADDGNLVVSSAPHISCASCTKVHIEQDIHYVCHKCSTSNADGTYALCLRCYRMGKGCRHWFGFGQAAVTRYERQVASGNLTKDYDIPHKMTPERYVTAENVEVPQANRARREQDWLWQRGKFCDMCFEQANKCHWRCDVCNDGEWGYCNNCVNRAQHCTHPLLPCAYTSTERGGDGRLQQHQQSPPLYISSSVTTNLSDQCTECHTQPPPLQPLFHCPSCNSGDYNLCLSCYTDLVATHRISPQNGPQGWRRCPQGHRMLVIAFDDVRAQDDPQHHPSNRKRRILLEGVVGGWALHDGEEGQGVKEKNQDGEREAATQLLAQDREHKTPSPTLQRWSWRDPESGGGWKHKKRPLPRVGGGGEGGRRPSTTSTSTTAADIHGSSVTNLPPSGGYGMKMQALWSRVPDEGVEDELTFPRGAVVEEVVDINGDWCWGVYCRRTGLFPGNWVTSV